MLAAVALMFSACGADDAIDEAQQQQTTPNVGEAISFSGTIAEGLYMENDDATRVDVSGADITAWHAGDKISVSDGTLNFTYSVKATTNDANCTFVPRDEENKFTSKATTFNAFYPAAAVLGWNGNTLSTMIYTEQDYVENKAGSTDGFGPYMVATATTTGADDNANFLFKPIASVIDVDLSTFKSVTNLDGELEVVSVSIYAKSKVSIAGKLNYTYNTTTGAGAITVKNNDATDYSYSTQSETVTVGGINKSLDYLVNDGIIRFYVLPVTITGGVVVTVRLSDGTYYSKETSTNVGTAEAVGLSVSGVQDGTVCKPYYKKYNSSNMTLTNNWMGTIPGNIKFNHLSIPGAHDAATSACDNNSAKCQAYTVAELLDKGCRALDLRPYYNSNSLVIFHGVASTGVTLTNALDAVTTFLDGHPTETVFILIAQEGGDDGNTNWQNRVWSCLNGYRNKNDKNYIADYGWEGKLNDCRGKMVVIFRNTYTGGTNNGDLGCGKVGWGSSFNDKTIMTGNGSGTGRGTLRYQDEYETTNTSTKLDNMTTMLNNHIAANETNAGYTFVNNVNIAGTLSNISSLSTSMNTAFLNSSTFTNHTGKFCIMFADFLHSSGQKGDQVYNLIRNQNYKYVYKGRTRRGLTTGGGTGTGVEIKTDEYADDTQVYSKRSF